MNRTCVWCSEQRILVLMLLLMSIGGCSGGGTESTDGDAVIGSEEPTTQILPLSPVVIDPALPIRLLQRHCRRGMQMGL